MSLLKAERHEADITESGKVFHRTAHDDINDDKNLAVDEMGNSTVFVRKLYAVLLLTDWGFSLAILTFRLLVKASNRATFSLIVDAKPK